MTPPELASPVSIAQFPQFPRSTSAQLRTTPRHSHSRSESLILLLDGSDEAVDELVGRMRHV